ncbi:MAG: hypothetical protein ACREDR_30115 [Blastocatellia bacterium]
MPPLENWKDSKRRIKFKPGLGLILDGSHCAETLIRRRELASRRSLAGRLDSNGGTFIALFNNLDAGQQGAASA